MAGRSRFHSAVAAMTGFALAVGAIAAVSLTRSLVNAAATTRPAHVAVVIMENHGYSQIIGNSGVPYINSLAAQGALMTQSFAVSHPSEPNYLALWSGSTQGISDDSCPHTFTTGSLGQQLIAAGLTVMGFNEGMPSDGYLGCSSGGYARKHNPLANWTATADAGHNKTYAAWPADFSTLPTVSVVVPTLCNDMHDCSVATGDSWLKSHWDPYVQWAKSHNSLAILTFDEDDGAEGNHIATVIAGQGVIPGRYSEHITHYNVLRTIEGFYGLGGLANAANAAQITDIFGTTLPPPAPKPSPSKSPTPTPALTVPGPPTAVKAVAGNHSALVSWTQPSTNGGSPILSYQLLTSDGTKASVAAGQTSTSVEHLQNGVAYSFVVKAVNAVGASAPSAASNIVVPQTPNQQGTSGSGSQSTGSASNGGQTRVSATPVGSKVLATNLVARIASANVGATAVVLVIVIAGIGFVVWRRARPYLKARRPPG